MELVLASASPRRAELLAVAGIPFRIDPEDLDETLREGELAEQYVVRLAVDKAKAGVRRNPGSLVIGADTTVVVDDRILGKPADPREAAEMLQLLSGRAHCVLTGVAVANEAGERSTVARTKVHFLPMSAGEIAWYVGTGEPFGKAGGYAIQGRASRFIASIDGSYSNVVGLPVSVTYELLQAFGWRQPPEAGTA